MHKLIYNILAYGMKYGPPPVSYSHRLPWIDGLSPERNVMIDYTLFDINHLDFDDDWVMEHAG